MRCAKMALWGEGCMGKRQGVEQLRRKENTELIFLCLERAVAKVRCADMGLLGI